MLLVLETFQHAKVYFSCSQKLFIWNVYKHENYFGFTEFLFKWLTDKLSKWMKGVIEVSIT